MKIGDLIVCNLIADDFSKNYDFISAPAYSNLKHSAVLVLSFTKHEKPSVLWSGAPIENPKIIYVVNSNKGTVLIADTDIIRVHRAS